MALPSAFHERLEQMEQTRNEQLSLLQDEKELQYKKSKVLKSKLSNIRCMERRCLKLDHKIASQHFIISSLNSQIDNHDSMYLNTSQQYRILKSEVQELEELEKEQKKYYGVTSQEMQEFKAQAAKFVAECQVQVEDLRSCLNELQSGFKELQRYNNYSNNSEIAAAEVRKSELIAVKENLDRTLASNYQIKAQLRKQIHSILTEQEKKRLCQFAPNKCFQQET